MFCLPRPPVTWTGCKGIKSSFAMFRIFDFNTSPQAVNQKLPTALFRISFSFYLDI